MRQRLGALFLLAVSFFLVACEREPADYNDCILKKVKEGMNEKAVSAIQTACAGKYIHSEPPQQLSESDLLLIEGQGRVAPGSHFSANLYNGTNYRIREITVTISATARGRKVDRLYRTPTDLLPQWTETISFEVIESDTSAEYEWSITEAIGFKATP